MIIDWSKSDIKQEISKITWAATEPRMDGFVRWGRKQDLYELLWFVQEQLDMCGTYVGEEEFVKQHEEEVRERKIVSKLRGQK
jgi:hypothetical protein